MKMNRRFGLFITLIVSLIWGTPLVTDAQLFDGEREGLLLGTGLGYAAIASGGEIEGSATGFALSGKVGYGVSDQLTLYFSSTVPSIIPSLGFMYFTEQDSDFYLQGALGYTSADQDSLFSISGGLGYELRDHVSLEFGLGYMRFSDTYTSEWNIWTGEIVNETAHSNIITIAATFNVHFY